MMQLFTTSTITPDNVSPPSSDSATASSSLDTEQLTVDPPHHDDDNQRYRFRGLEDERARWLQVLPQIETTHRTVERFLNCGRSAWVQYSPSRGTRRIVSNTCRLRVCPACRKAIQHTLADQLHSAVGEPEPNEWKFLTLTIKHTSAPLKHQLDFLRKSFRKLRQRVLFKKYVEHGWAVIELNYNEKDAQWHPHLHCLVRCNYIPQQLLSDSWNSITLGSKIVDIRVVKHSKLAAKYVAKYVGKAPADTITDDLDLAREYYHALKGARMLIAFGKERPPLPEVMRDDYPNDWVYEEPLQVLLNLADNDDYEAIRRLETVSQEPEYMYHEENPPQPG